MIWAVYTAIRHGSVYARIGATVSDNVSICGGCMIGACAVVVGDVSESGTYVGVPIKRCLL